MFQWIVLIGIGVAIWWFVQKKSQPSQFAIANDNVSSKWKYTHEAKGTAIGLCPEERLIRLTARFPSGIQTKDYSYDDVREWRFNIASGGMTKTHSNVGVSASLSIGVANINQHYQNERDTGLFLLVKDIDFPEWQVRFPPSKARELELKRWMEILRQELNDSAAV